jgi:hypothetical protein
MPTASAPSGTGLSSSHPERSNSAASSAHNADTSSERSNTTTRPPDGPSRTPSDRSASVAYLEPGLPVPETAGGEPSRTTSHVSRKEDAAGQSPVYSGDEAQRVTSRLSEKPYSAFSKSTKWFIVSLMGITAVCACFNSSISANSYGRADHQSPQSPPTSSSPPSPPLQMISIDPSKTSRSPSPSIWSSKRSHPLSSEALQIRSVVVRSV